MPSCFTKRSYFAISCRVREYAVADIPARGTLPAVLSGASSSRWLSPLRTLGRAMASGEIRRREWWLARGERYRQFSVQARQKWTDKYRLRVHDRSRTVHEAFRASSALADADLAAMRVAAGRFRYQPVLSVLCPVYNVDPRWLNAAVESVRRPR